jgi:hypothetical protein
MGRRHLNGVIITEKIGRMQETNVQYMALNPLSAIE